MKINKVDKNMPKWEKLEEPKATFKEKYQQELQQKEWLELKDEIMKISDYKCEICGIDNQPLNVHHKEYISGRKAWQYNKSLLQCVCIWCHKALHHCSICKEKIPDSDKKNKLKVLVNEFGDPTHMECQKKWMKEKHEKDPDYFNFLSAEERKLYLE